MRSKIALLSTVPLLVVAAACGSDDDSGDDSATDDASDVTEAASDDADEATGDAADAEESDQAETDDAAESDDSATDPPPAPSGGGTATLTLDNGETFEFEGVLCSLEPQMSAGSEILFTAVSYGDPGFDVTQFGDEGTVTGVASISVYDGNYETLWDANTMFGSDVELSLDGSTITGTGVFIEGGEDISNQVAGTVVANC